MPQRPAVSHMPRCPCPQSSPPRGTGTFHEQNPTSQEPKRFAAEETSSDSDLSLSACRRRPQGRSSTYPFPCTVRSALVLPAVLSPNRSRLIHTSTVRRYS